MRVMLLLPNPDPGKLFRSTAVAYVGLLDEDCHWEISLVLHIDAARSTGDDVTV